MEDGGLEALRARYDELREEYFGRGAYEFGPRPLERVAEAVARGDSQGAMAVVELNLEHHPESFGFWLLKGQIHAFEDETEAAIEAYEKSLELVHDNPPATQALQRLMGGGL